MIVFRFYFSPIRELFLAHDCFFSHPATKKYKKHGRYTTWHIVECFFLQSEEIVNTRKMTFRQPSALLIVEVDLLSAKNEASNFKTLFPRSVTFFSFYAMMFAPFVSYSAKKNHKHWIFVKVWIINFEPFLFSCHHVYLDCININEKSDARAKVNRKICPLRPHYQVQTFRDPSQERD